ncbi:hypothetical protein LQ327_00020 [Actinomycetospora endophytica]|uniref:Antibiotic biosynthesis monooxygenase n=1 Tax=Actinomycetospora endophytica TaxID=2291215 RepID=A0ABS8P0I9_9PSEU|nr:hypothetical protein [Actinomycetospora endophytica]MCD2191777.1 hypothetical protein [Actinomycetospora endophytica]
MVNVARWESEAHWRAAVAAAGWDSSGQVPRNSTVAAQPALYRVVHLTPDPKTPGTPVGQDG